MVYCEQDMCESKLGRLMQAFRADRPSEWQMDEFIGMAENMQKMNKELMAAMEEVHRIAAGSNMTHNMMVICDHCAEAIAKAKGTS